MPRPLYLPPSPPDLYHEHEPPADLPVTDRMIRCGRCNRLLAELATRPWTIRCSRCKAANRA